MMAANRTATPTRVRTPVRPVATTTPRASPMTRTSTAASTTAARTTTPRATIASSPIVGIRGASPGVRNAAPAPPATTAAYRNPSPLMSSSRNASPGIRNPSPGSRVVTPVRMTAPSYALTKTPAETLPSARSGSRLGIVSSPRVGTVTTRTESPLRSSRLSTTSPHMRETSAVQKAAVKKETDEMAARVNQIMAIKKPEIVAGNYFRIDMRRQDDMRLAHIERIMVDPENAKTKRVTSPGGNRALTSHMQGILGSQTIGTPRNRPDLGDIPQRGRTQYTAAYKSADMVCGTRKAAADEQSASVRRETESARRLRASSAADSAPWNKGPSVYAPPSQRAASAQRLSRNPSPISFDPTAPIDKPRTRLIGAAHQHHDVFADAPGSDARAARVSTPRVQRTKTAEVIRQQMAAEPPAELPPRKKPALKSSPNAGAVNDIFNAPYGDAGACSVRSTVGKKIVDSLGRSRTPTSGGSNPNQMNDRSADINFVKAKRTVSPIVSQVGAAGARSDNIAHSPEKTHKRANPDRNVSSIGNDGEGLQSSRAALVMSPVRRPAPTAARNASNSANAPFGTDTNEWQSTNKGTVGLTSSGSAPASPSRYTSPVERARGARSPGFYGRPTSAMKSVFNWDS